MENKRSKVLISILLVVLCLSVCVGLTYAYFTDSAKSSGNKIQAGNLKLDLKLYDKVDDEWISIKNTEDPVFNYEKWEPGYVDAKLLKIENLGDLAMQWEAKLVSAETVSAFANAIEVYVQKSNTEIAYPADRAAALAWTKVGTLDQFINTAEKLANGTFTAQGEAYYIGIAFYMPAEITDNTLQGKVLGAFDIQINATQLPYESDAFDENYDEGAKLPCGHYETKRVIVKEATFDEHGQQNIVCTECDAIIATEDIYLVFEKSADESYYTVIGRSADLESTSIVIPATYNNLPVTEIGDSAFFGDETITSVIISDGVTTIGEDAFYESYALTDLVIPDSITTIGEGAFRGCPTLKSVHITDLAAWCNIAFGSLTANPLNHADNLYLDGSLLTELVIPDSVTTIGNYAFCYYSKLTSVEIPDSVTVIGDSAFYFCDGLTELIIPDSVTVIGDCAFYRCLGLTELIIPDSVTIIGEEAFYWCDGLTELTIGNGVTTIGRAAFADTSMTSLTIPDNVASIGELAFNSCKELMSITVGKNVTSIGEKAFRGCYRLVQVYNFSDSLTITEGWSDNGYAGFYAHGVFTSADVVSKLWTDENGYIFYEDGDECYLVSHANSRALLPLPADCNGKSYAINRYAFYNRAFGAYDNGCEYITIHNNITYIGEYALASVGLIFFENTGWYCTETGYDENFQIPMLESELADPVTAAKLLLSEYYWCTWTNSKYTWDRTYTFETNGGDAIADITSKTGITLPTPNREGYTFAGWYDNAEFKGVALKSPYCGSGGTLYAKWMTGEEVAAFEQATNMELNQTYTYEFTTVGEKVYCAFTPETSGVYTFFSSDWWNISGYLCNADRVKISSLAHHYGASSISYPFTAGETYYFVAEFDSEYDDHSFDITVSVPVTYTFETNCNDIFDTYVSGSDVHLDTPYNEGAVFAGWYDNPEFTGNVLASPYHSTKDCTLYAKWLTPEEIAEQAIVMQPDYTYTNTISGGEKVYYAFTANKSGIYRLLLNGNVSMNVDLYESDLSEIYIDKDGWEDYSNISFTEYLTEGETYYFVAELIYENYTGSFDVIIVAPYTYTFETNGGNPIESVVTSVSFKLPTPKKDGAIFLGWYDNTAFNGDSLSSWYRGTADCTLYAKWMTKAECESQATVIEADRAYTANITIGGQRVLYAFTAGKSGTHTLSLSGDFYPYGYLYDSNLNQVEYDGDSEDEFLVPIYLTAGETYYLVAKFYSDTNIGSFDVTVISPFTYTFETNGGNTIQTIVTSVSVTLPTPEKAGAIFLGWYDNATFEGDPLPSWYRGTGDCTLYAKWMTKDDIADQVVDNMQANNTYDAEIALGGQRLVYTFTPEASGTYMFSASGYYDTYGYLYDSNLVELDHNDDDGDGSNFSISYQLEAGNTYYLIVRMCYSSQTGSFTVTVTKNN